MAATAAAVQQRLQAQLSASKTAQGRQELLDSGTLEGLAREAAVTLAQWESLVKFAEKVDDEQQVTLQVLLLRLLRNSCALGAAAAAVLLDQHLQQVVADAAAGVAVFCSEQQQQCAAQRVSDWLVAAVQLLHNLSATGGDAAAAVWRALFPTAFNNLLLLDNGRLHEAAALTALSCARSSSSQGLQDLTSGTAHTAWCRLLAPLMPQAAEQYASSSPAGQAQHPGTAPTTAAATASDAAGAVAPAALTVPPGNDNLCMLVKCVSMQHNKLQDLLQLLSSSSHSAQAGMGPPDTAESPLQLTEQQAVLLHVVAVEAAAVPAASPLPGLTLGHSTQQQNGSSSSSSWLQCAVQLLHDVWSQVSAAAVPTAGVCSQPTATAHVLEAVLQVLKAVLARDEDTAEAQPGREAEAAAAAGLAAVAQHLHQLGLVQQLLQMLTALGPPPKTKQQQQRELEQQQQQQGVQPAQPPPQQQQQPYAGYRADVVAVLSNLLLGGRGVQDAVMSAGGIELLLNNCNLDESSPMSREWALWGIRNACHGNEAVQAYVSQFQAVDAVQSPELDRMGMQLELDQMTHKLKLTKKPGGQVDCSVVDEDS